MPSDGPDYGNYPNARSVASNHVGGLWIHHYGFLRQPDAFIEKSIIVQDAFFGNVDPRILETHAEHHDWRRRDYFGQPLLPAPRAHPAMMHEWLRARGYALA